MKYKFVITAVFTLLFANFAMADNEAVDDRELYAQQSFYAENGTNFGTNYGTGTCHPVNEKFKMVKINTRLFGQGDSMTVSDLNNGGSIEIKNVNKYTHLTISGLKDRMFSDKEVNLTGHSQAVREAISKCEVIKGMTKEEVLLARGYPPTHTTASLDSNVWTYWYQRMSKGTVNFTNGKVTSIEGSIQPRTMY